MAIIANREEVEMGLSVIRPVCVATAIAILGASALPSAAKIRCKGRFQIVSGQGLISTPYCECNYLSYVASRYGVRAGARALCANVNLKEDVCKVVGHDNRVRDICAGFTIQDRGGRYPN